MVRILIHTITSFLKSRFGMAVLFVVIFYVLTFLVYYFYSPGPEERRQAELEKNVPQTQTTP